MARSDSRKQHLPCSQHAERYPAPVHNTRPLVSLALALLAAGHVLACSNNDPETEDPPAPPTEDPPAPIAGVDVAAVSPRNVRLRWQPVDNAQVVIRRAAADSDFEEVGRKEASRRRFLDLALDPESTYTYQLSVCRGDNCSEPYETDPVTTPESPFPPIDISVPSENPGDDLAVFGLYRVSAELMREGHMVAMDRTGRIV